MRATFAFVVFATVRLLRRIATDRPGDLSRYLDAPRLDRFGAAFAAEISEKQDG